MVKLEHCDALQRPMRKDDWPELGVSTVTKAFQAIDDGRTEEAKELVLYLKTELLLLHDNYADWLWDFYTYIGGMGEEELSKYYEQRQYMENFLYILPTGSVEECVQGMAEFMRGHGSGEDRLGNIDVRDEGTRYVVESDPCGSGGRMRRGDAFGPRTQAPFNNLVVKNAYPWTWGKPNVPAYCTHCAALEIASIHRFGYPIFVTDYSEDPNLPCRYLFYKRPEDIPEEFFNRLGKVKPSSYK